MGQLPTEQLSAPLTTAGMVLGTFQYMSPEQLEGKESDPRSDLFALGCVLYEMATGKKAFSGNSQASLIGAIMHSTPPPVSSVATLTPPALDRVISTCLAKDPKERWHTAHDVRCSSRGSPRAAPPRASPPRWPTTARTGRSWPGAWRWRPPPWPRSWESAS